MANAPRAHANPPFWRDERVLKLLAQLVFGAAVLIFGYILIQNMINGLRQQGTTLGIGFLQNTAGFDLAETLNGFTRSSAYIQAFLAGLYNTLLVSAVGVLFSTILGIILGVARLSSNLLVRTLATAYLELMRNLSLLVFLIFWYLAVFLKLPLVREAITWPGNIILSNRGIGIPWGIPTETWPAFKLFLLGGLALALVITVAFHFQGKRTGKAPLAIIWAPLAFLAVAAAGWFVQSVAPLSLDLPAVQGLNIRGGRIFTPEFMALTSGLVLYTAAFIGEVVRAGIQAVSKGQVEAARAIGLSSFQTLRLVVFPQALQVIIPPLTSQYLNLTKNSSLAIAVGYPDLFYVSNTILNQSGRAVEMITLVMLTYLLFSLITSIFMNWYNARVRLVER
ncbi:MAG: ABC transporter permease subunit [Anaerolineales bacterium]|nr:MAG: ABC transporter permease subunit [Anaerolineales bacterium]